MSDLDPNIVAAADRLRQAEASGTACPPILDLVTKGDIEAAYAVQELNTARALEDGRRLVGRKIGLTAAAVQVQLGVDQPDFGMLFADMALDDGATVAPGRLIAPKVEAEVAFVLDRGVGNADATLPEVLGAVGYCLPALEIVDSRVADWKISIADTVADNASAGLYVLGNDPRRLDGLDLRLCGMVLERNGVGTSFGAGAACLGHPLNALLWLVRKMAAIGRPLEAGDVVLSGALGPMVPAAPGDRFEARISGLGAVRVGFGG